MEKMKENVETFMAFNKDFNDANIIYFGAPYDGTVSFRPGARFAPEAIRRDSYGLETYSPYFRLDLEKDTAVFDAGDLLLPIGNKEKSLELIYSFTKRILRHKKTPFMVGGEHLISLSSIKAVFEAYKDLHIIHFDAHADLRDTYMGDSLSHSTVLRRIWEVVGDKRIHQLGIRSGLKEEFTFSRNHCSIEFYRMDSIEDLVEELISKPVYITFDLDILEPGLFSGTGTPEPGGVTFREAIEAFKSMIPLNIVGVDVVELSPNYDQSGVSTLYACKIIRELVLAMNY